jgi:hypothetical protein
MKPFPLDRLAVCPIDGLPLELRAYDSVVMIGCALDHVAAYDGPRLAAPAVQRFRQRPRCVAPACFTDAVRAHALGWRPQVM